MGAREFAALVGMFTALLGQACLIDEPVSGPIELTAEWKTVTPPRPLRIPDRHQQYFCMDAGTTLDADFDTNVMLVDGQPHKLQGEAVDSEQTRYPLRILSVGAGGVCLGRAGEVPAGPDFPIDRKMAALRIRSEPPVRVRKIRWVAYNNY